jgi:LysM repeat protein
MPVAAMSGYDTLPLVRRKHWLTLVVVFALADLALLAILLFNVFVPPASADLPATLAFATYQSGEVAPLPPTPSATSTALPLPPPATPVITYTYTVVTGDTLWDIARRFNVSMATLIEANPALNPDQLYPGDVLIIPAVFGPVETATPTESPTGPPPSPTPPPSETPTVPTPTLVGPVMAQVSAEGDRLRLRAGPGTAGSVLAYLQPFVPMTLLGRTADNVWAEAVIPGGDHGWVMARWLDVFVSLDDLPVTGIAVDASPTPPPPTRAPTQVVPTNTPKPTKTTAPTSTPFVPTATIPPTLPPPTSTPTSPPTSTPPPTPAPTQVPAYPFISGISERARQIFLQGQVLGNRADVFSKVGDSITVSPAFLNPVGVGNYNLRDYAYLQPVVDYFTPAVARDANSFANTSIAAKGGWSAWSIVDPYVSNANCQSGETPLECEYRLVRPAVALIMAGTNDVQSTPAETYERNLRRIIEISIQRGVIPVVSTIPPLHRSWAVGRVELINGIVVRLAQEYEVPLWDYGSALQGLPNDGLSGDGVHPSAPPDNQAADFTAGNLQYGYTVRNLTALQALDAVWRFALHP